MEAETKISQLENLLPYGSKKIIAKRANTSESSVKAFFRGTLKRVDKKEVILSEAVKYYKELKNREKTLLESIAK